MAAICRSLALVLLLAACAETSDTTASTTAPSSTTTTALPSTTTTRPTTTTTVRATTTTTNYLVVPSEDERLSYLLIAAVVHGDGPFSADEMGLDEWGVMLRDGAIAACHVFAADGTLDEAIAAAMSRTPVANVSPDNYEDPAKTFSIAATLLRSGAPTYCPSVAPDLRTDQGTKELVNAWQLFQGLEATDFDMWIEDGTWRVGADIEPGTYRNSGEDGCYWERLSGFSGTSDDIIANGFPDGDAAIVTIQSTDAGFLSEDCNVWFPVDD